MCARQQGAFFNTDHSMSNPVKLQLPFNKNTLGNYGGEVICLISLFSLCKDTRILLGESTVKYVFNL